MFGCSAVCVDLCHYYVSGGRVALDPYSVFPSLWLNFLGSNLADFPLRCFTWPNLLSKHRYYSTLEVGPGTLELTLDKIQNSAACSSQHVSTRLLVRVPVRLGDGKCVSSRPPLRIESTFGFASSSPVSPQRKGVKAE